MKTYETVQGDTWDQIAVKQYGSERLIQPLLEANSDCQDMIVFPSGVQLNVPELPSSSDSATSPWRDDR